MVYLLGELMQEGKKRWCLCGSSVTLVGSILRVQFGSAIFQCVDRRFVERVRRGWTKSGRIGLWGVGKAKVFTYNFAQG